MNAIVVERVERRRRPKTIAEAMIFTLVDSMGKQGDVMLAREAAAHVPEV